MYASNLSFSECWPAFSETPEIRVFHPIFPAEVDFTKAYCTDIKLRKRVNKDYKMGKGWKNHLKWYFFHYFPIQISASLTFPRHKRLLDEIAILRMENTKLRKAYYSG